MLGLNEYTLIFPPYLLHHFMIELRRADVLLHCLMHVFINALTNCNVGHNYNF
jgi:hypothetical protein